MAITTGTYQLYRSGVMVATGTMLGSTTFSYTPPDGGNYNYEARYNVPQASTGRKGTLYRRSIQITAQRR